MIPFNFNQIVTENGKAFLHDASAEEIRRARAKEYADAYEDIRRMLVTNEYPASREWIEAIAADGSDGLRRMVTQETERRIKADNLPPFIANMWRRTCANEVPIEMWEEADAARRTIIDKADGLPVQPSDLVFQEDKIVALDGLFERIAKACRIEITDKMKAEAERVVKLAQELRTMSVESGLNVLELVRKYARADEMPAPSSPSVLNDIVFRRHAPGAIEPSEDTALVMNLAAMQSQKINNLTR